MSELASFNSKKRGRPLSQDEVVKVVIDLGDDDQAIFQSQTKKPKTLAPSAKRAASATSSHSKKTSSPRVSRTSAAPTSSLSNTRSPKKAVAASTPSKLPPASPTSPKRGKKATPASSPSTRPPMPPITTHAIAAVFQSNKMDVDVVPYGTQPKVIPAHRPAPIPHAKSTGPHVPIHQPAMQKSTTKWTPGASSAMSRNQSAPPPHQGLWQSNHAPNTAPVKKGNRYPITPLEETPKSAEKPKLAQEALEGPVPSWGLPKFVVEILNHRGIKKIHDWQRECLTSTGILDGKSLVYSLPTSGGKTFVAEITLMRTAWAKKKVGIFALPLISIVLEKVKSLKEFGKKLGFDVEGYYQNSGRIPLPKTKPIICICTNEKANMLINSLIEEGRLGEVGVVVFDELHTLGESDRGYMLEILGTKIKFASNNSIQLVGMSATLPNLGDLAKWFDGSPFYRNFRPVELQEYVFKGFTMLTTKVCAPSTPGGLSFYEPRKVGVLVPPTADAPFIPGLTYHAFTTIGMLVRQLMPQKSSLVFCSSKAMTVKMAAELGTWLEAHPPTNDRSLDSHITFEASASDLHIRKDYSDELRLTATEFRNRLATVKDERDSLIIRVQAVSPSREIDPILRQCLSQGVAWHNADLSQPVREQIESAFRDKIISVICCTSTLAAGVNLPARRVIIAKAKVGMNPLGVTQYRQMTGRAGRAGYDDLGESFLINDDARTDEDAISLLATPLSPVTSTLGVSESRVQKSNFQLMRQSRNEVQRLARLDSRIDTVTYALKHGVNIINPEEPVISLFCVGLPGKDPRRPEMLDPTGLGIDRLVLDAIGGRLAVTHKELCRFLSCTFLATSMDLDGIAQKVTASLRFLSTLEFIVPVSAAEANIRQAEDPDYDSNDQNARSKPRGILRHYEQADFDDEDKSVANEQKIVYVVTNFGAATYRTAFTIETAIYMREEVDKALKSLSLASDLHLCWLVAPVFGLGKWGPNKMTAWATMAKRFESEAVMETSSEHPAYLWKRIGAHTRVFYNESQQEESPWEIGRKAHWTTIQRFFMALILEEVVAEVHSQDICDKYDIAPGDLEGLKTNASSHAAQLVGFCKRLGHWHLEAVLKIFSMRVGFGVKEDIIPLMKIRNVKAARARMLYVGGFRTIRAIALAQPTELSKVLSKNQSEIHAVRLATGIIRNAKKFLEASTDDLRSTVRKLEAPTASPELVPPSKASNAVSVPDPVEFDLAQRWWDHEGEEGSDDDTLDQLEIEFALAESQQTQSQPQTMRAAPAKGGRGRKASKT